MPTWFRIWFREIFGLFLVLVGLWAWGICMNFLNNIQLIEGAFVFFMGLVSFKAGVHMMKVGLAAHILLTEPKIEDKTPNSPT